jgi:hypothetical protein
VSRSAITALASAVVLRPDGASAPSTLEPAIRAACAAAWSALEVALAGKALTDQLVTTDGRTREASEGVVALIGSDLRAGVIEELRAARASGQLEEQLELPALLAGCARVGDSPVVVSARRRVRTVAIDHLRATLGSRRALASALGDTALAALLVDTARAGFRLAARDERTLAPWAMPPTGTTSRDRALTAFCELARDRGLLAELDPILAGLVGAPVAAEAPPASEAATAPVPVVVVATSPAPLRASAPEAASEPRPEPVATLPSPEPALEAADPAPLGEARSPEPAAPAAPSEPGASTVGTYARPAPPKGGAVPSTGWLVLAIVVIVAAAAGLAYLAR